MEKFLPFTDLKFYHPYASTGVETNIIEFDINNVATLLSEESKSTAEAITSRINNHYVKSLRHVKRSFGSKQTENFQDYNWGVTNDVKIGLARDQIEMLAMFYCESETKVTESEFFAMIARHTSYRKLQGFRKKNIFRDVKSAFKKMAVKLPYTALTVHKLEVLDILDMTGVTFDINIERLARDMRKIDKYADRMHMLLLDDPLVNGSISSRYIYGKPRYKLPLTSEHGLGDDPLDLIEFETINKEEELGEDPVERYERQVMEEEREYEAEMKRQEDLAAAERERLVAENADSCALILGNSDESSSLLESATGPLKGKGKSLQKKTLKRNAAVTLPESLDLLGASAKLARRAKQSQARDLHLVQTPERRSSIRNKIASASAYGKRLEHVGLFVPHLPFGTNVSDEIFEVDNSNNFSKTDKEIEAEIMLGKYLLGIGVDKRESHTAPVPSALISPELNIVAENIDQTADENLRSATTENKKQIVLEKHQTVEKIADKPKEKKRESLFAQPKPKKDLLAAAESLSPAPKPAAKKKIVTPAKESRATSHRDKSPSNLIGDVMPVSLDDKCKEDLTSSLSVPMDKNVETSKMPYEVHINNPQFDEKIKFNESDKFIDSALSFIELPEVKTVNLAAEVLLEPFLYDATGNETECLGFDGGSAPSDIQETAAVEKDDVVTFQRLQLDQKLLEQPNTVSASSSMQNLEIKTNDKLTHIASPKDVRFSSEQPISSSLISLYSMPSVDIEVMVPKTNGLLRVNIRHDDQGEIHGLFVHGFLSYSKAEESGLIQIGDELLKVEDKVVCGGYLEDVVNILKNHEGDYVKILLRRRTTKAYPFTASGDEIMMNYNASDYSPRPFVVSNRPTTEEDDFPSLADLFSFPAEDIEVAVPKTNGQLRIIIRHDDEGDVHGLFVHGFRPFSKAEESGLVRLGDELLKVNDVIVKGGYLEDVINALKNDQNDTVKLLLRRHLPEGSESAISSQLEYADMSPRPYEVVNFIGGDGSFPPLEILFSLPAHELTVNVPKTNGQLRIQIRHDDEGDAHGLFIHGFRPFCIAEEQGVLKLGDELIMIEGVSVKGGYLEDVVNILKNHQDNSVNMVIRRHYMD